jgi:gamma-D-glutamyl-L-lysine dipeptidyl-peptidase
MMNRTQLGRMFMLMVVILAVACTRKSDRTVTGLNTMLGELKQVYAPDDRTEWWQVTLEEEEGGIVLKGEVTSRAGYDDILERVRVIYPGVNVELQLLPPGDSGKLVNALVNNSVIHLRSEPSSKKELITQALLGTPVRILKSEGSKSLIQVPDGYIGWVNTAEVHSLDSEGLAAYREAEKVIFTAQYGLSYSEPDEGSMPVSDLVIGNILTKISEKSGYCQVGYPDGRLGWVNCDDLVPAREIFFKPPLKENLVQTALRYNGIPYLWGGTSSKDIDCSGLVSNVYFLNGLQLPRDADMQALIGRELTTDYDTAGLEPGDLLFYGRKATEDTPENVTHVAMYIGDGAFIHSAGYRERVSINSMDNTSADFIDSYPEIFVRAVRILGEAYEGFIPVSENAFYREIISDIP